MAQAHAQAQAHLKRQQRAEAWQDARHWVFESIQASLPMAPHKCDLFAY